MGYSIKSKKINITLTPEQQESAVKIWNDFLLDTSMKTKGVYYVLEQIENIEQYRQATAEDFLDLLNFQYEKKGSNLKIKKFEGKMSHERLFFEKIVNIISPGSYISWRGEDGAFFGWFFNNELVSYNSCDELNTLRQPFELKKKLEKSLPVKVTEARKMKL